MRRLSPLPPGTAGGPWAAGLLAVALAAGCVGGGAETPRWIWATHDPSDEEPAVVFAVRDFNLRGEVRRAELEILGDEEYWAFLNGLPVGAGRYRARTGWDRYDVAADTREGANRLTIELRSARGTGGLLARLTVADVDGERTLVSDGGWQIAHRHRPAFLNPEEELGEELETPHVWGEPPLGRWRVGDGGRALPLTTEIRITENGVEPRRYRQGARIRGWRRFVRQRRDPEPLGNWVTFDWGVEVTGYVSLGFAAPREDLGKGLLWASMEPIAYTVGVDPRVDPYDAVILAAPGRNWWTDALPRRFRYLYVLGLEELALAEVYPVEAQRAAPLLVPLTRPAGVWGLDPPRLMTPVEDEVWRQLQGVSGVSGR